MALPPRSWWYQLEFRWKYWPTYLGKSIEISEPLDGIFVSEIMQQMGRQIDLEEGTILLLSDRLCVMFVVMAISQIFID